jgi:hypothetical protein
MNKVVLVMLNIYIIRSKVAGTSVSPLLSFNQGNAFDPQICNHSLGEYYTTASRLLQVVVHQGHPYILA